MSGVGGVSSQPVDPLGKNLIAKLSNFTNRAHNGLKAFASKLSVNNNYALAA